MPDADTHLTDGDSKAEAFTLAYLSCPQTSDKGYVGALLITDYRTRPLHFAYVTPVRPTSMQRILYGTGINSAVKVDVIARKLLTANASIIPTILFVDAEDLIEVRSVARYPVCWLQRGPQDAASLSTLICKTNGDPADGAAAGRVVSMLESSVNLLDPFARLREALKEALKSEVV